MRTTGRRESKDCTVRKDGGGNHLETNTFTVDFYDRNVIQRKLIRREVVDWNSLDGERVLGVYTSPRV